MIGIDNRLPQKAYMMRMGLSMGAYVISLVAGEYLVSRDLVDGPVVWLLALVPGLSIVGAFYAIGRLILDTKDEFIRMLIVRQALIATGFALSVATVWGLLENFELVDHVDAYWIAVLWFFGCVVGAISNKLTYGAWGQLK